ASELKSILSFSIDKKIDRTSLFEYLQLSYVPAPNTILKDVRKLEPGCHLTTNGGELSVKRYYRLPGAGEGDAAGTGGVDSYEHAVDRVREVLDDAVRSRLVSDVPLGAFLSGGIDSSVVAALAARHAPQLQTFSVGFRDDEFYDETPDALDAARKMGTNHTAFILTTDDLFGSLHDALDYLDEPFADSSALAVYILSRRTKEHVTVALSGDGADELLGGYNKHYAEYRARRGGAAARLVTAFHPLWRALPASRDTAFANGVRQLRRFSRAARLPAPERYWEWCKFTESDDALEVLADRSVAGGESYRRRVRDATAGIKAHGDLNDVLRADVGLVLPNDMLRKVDLMSMASSLEVRVPYLDHRFVELCFALPVTFKLGSGVRKRILRDAFASMLPESVLTKPKHGFEVPLMRWFRSGLKSLIETDLLADDFVRAQGIFDAAGVAALRSRLFSASPGDVAPLVWALIVFQHWWKKYMS
ncbi:MAG: asparagine synthase C-terminal domain-containing protein, partial [Candidatus Latescibacterota bacterium]